MKGDDCAYLPFSNSWFWLVVLLFLSILLNLLTLDSLSSYYEKQGNWYAHLASPLVFPLPPIFIILFQFINVYYSYIPFLNYV